jgi:hypothetical protein
VNCVLKLVVGDKNPEHFFVATQDAHLREKLSQYSSFVSPVHIYSVFVFFKENLEICTCTAEICSCTLFSSM